MNRRLIAIGTWIDYDDNFWQVTGTSVWDQGLDKPMERYYLLTDADYDHAMVSAAVLEDAAVANGKDYIRLKLDEIS